MSVYEKLEELMCDSENSGTNYTPENIKVYITLDDESRISNDVDEKLRKKLGEEKYQKLEDYLMANKDNKDLKRIIPELTLKMVISNPMDFINEFRMLDTFSNDHESKYKEEKIDMLIKVVYKLAINLYERLEKSEYDTERVLLDLWG